MILVIVIIVLMVLILVHGDDATMCVCWLCLAEKMIHGMCACHVCVHAFQIHVCKTLLKF